jgi:small-conductance mechanosensitive channel
MLEDMLDFTFWGNTLKDYLLSAVILVGGLLAVTIVRGVVNRRAKARKERPAAALEDFLYHMAGRFVFPMLYLGVFYVALKSLVLGPALKRAVDVAGVILLTVIAIRLAIALLYQGVENYWLKGREGLPQRQDIIRLLPVLKVLIWAGGIVFLLDNLGFKVSAVVAGLGIGGVAVALAAQAVLGDLFSYFAILFDRPFEIGDFIILDDYMGTIEHIGIKTTRIRSLGGEQVVMSNSDLTNSRIRNYKRMARRRVVFRFGVVYQSSAEQLKEIPAIIREIIIKQEKAEFDRAHFFAFGDSSLDFEVVFYVLSGDYTQYMDIQEGINLAIMEEFASRGIEFAYPTRTLYMSKEGGGGA